MIRNQPRRTPGTSCPSCRETLAPKALKSECGSCGHAFEVAPVVRSAAFPTLLLCALTLVGVAAAVYFPNQKRHAREKAEFEENLRLSADHRFRLERELDRSNVELHGSRAGSERMRNEMGELREQLQQAKRLLSAHSEEAEQAPAVRAAAPPAACFHPDPAVDVDFLERVLQSQPQNAEAHYQLSVAYDRLGRPDSSARSFEHAKQAIKLDTNYKKRFQPFIRNSRTARKVGEIIHNIIQKSEESQISDDEAQRYADQIRGLLGPQAPAGK